MTLDLEIAVDKTAAAALAAAHIQRQLGEAIAGRGRGIMAVSGGSTPRLMFQQFSRDELDWDRVELFFVDERCIPPEHEDSNFRMTREALIEPLGLDPAHVHRIEGEREPEVAATKYADRVLEVFGLRRSETPVFDVIHLGMGGDSHTASLFPGSEAINDREGIAKAVYAASRKSWRVTLLPKVLLAAREINFLVTGADKAGALRGIAGEPVDAQARPAQLVAAGHGNVRWFVDAAAAGQN